jgi:hypothetical protein
VQHIVHYGAPYSQESPVEACLARQKIFVKETPCIPVHFTEKGPFRDVTC